MLALDSSRWSKLDRGFRPVDGIPGLLRAIDADPKCGRWSEVYTYLCHQGGTIYPVTFAAVPHIVSSAARLLPSERRDHLLFVGLVESARTWSAPLAVPDDLKPDHDAAVGQARALIPETLSSRPWNENEMKYLLAAYANLFGQPRLGHVIEALEDDSERIGCPECGADLAALD